MNEEARLAVTPTLYFYSRLQSAFDHFNQHIFGGAAYGGPLSCLVLEGEQMGFFVSEHDSSTAGALADAISYTINTPDRRL